MVTFEKNSFYANYWPAVIRPRPPGGIVEWSKVPVVPVAPRPTTAAVIPIHLHTLNFAASCQTVRRNATVSVADPPLAKLSCAALNKTIKYFSFLCITGHLHSHGSYLQQLHAGSRHHSCAPHPILPGSQRGSVISPDGAKDANQLPPGPLSMAARLLMSGRLK